jgi:hypothetical protein
MAKKAEGTMPATILLEDVWQASSDFDEYKVHFARWNGEHQPLDVWVRSRDEWLGWQEYRPKNDDFNRPKIFSLMSFYHEPDTWLFGGILIVKERRSDGYVVELTKELAPFIGRLKINCAYPDRQTRPKLEGVVDLMTVKEVLATAYTGRHFPGFENIDVSFEELEALVRQGRSDWQAPLASVKGVYLITDTNAGKRYVGAAVSGGGVWSRWQNYIDTGHGGNVGLQPFFKKGGLDYYRKHLRFTLLEHRSGLVSDEVIYAREKHWKDILFSRLELNRN